MAAVTQAIIGTAGHIDHGKTALIKALTGQDTDRLKEEKERGISIDLGFAWLTLGDGRRAGIVDVPGHERFIHNMLAGAHGVDLALFVVAADDGIMPQSEEHFDLLHLLGVRHAIFVITKADLVASDRIAEVAAEIRLMAENSAMAAAPVIAVSSRSGAGLDALREEIARQLSRLRVRPESGIFRLPVDRTFVVKGHGTVVTGTARGAGVRVGQKLRVLPEGGEVRVRAIEIHGQQVTEALSSQRVALNLSGAERMAIDRGVVLADERLNLRTSRLDVRLEIRPGAQRPLSNNDHVRLFLATAQAMGRVIILETADSIAAQHDGLAQIVLHEPLVAVGGDRFVLRDETGRRTIGGGIVLNPLGQSVRRPRDRYRARLAAMERLPGAAAVEAFLNLQSSFALDAAQIAIVLGRPLEELAPALADPCLVPAGSGEERVFTTRDKWEAIRYLVAQEVATYHRQAPLAPGIELEYLRTRLPFAIGAREFKPIIDRLARELGMVRTDSIVRAGDHQALLAGDDRALANRILAAMAQSGLQMPDLKQLGERLGIAALARLRGVMAALARQDEAVRIGADQYLLPADLALARARLEEFLRQRQTITAAAYRDLLSVSRRVAIALLDYFDHAGFTTRVGDERRLRHDPAQAAH